MAYCVHCGVKLGDGEKKCPLCNTQVFDPSAPAPSSSARLYPVRTPDQELKRSKHFFLALMAVMLLCPAALCLVLDLLLGNGLTWSKYAASALILLFVSCSVTLLVPRYRIYCSIGTVFICLSGYLWIVQALSKSDAWFFPIVLPSLALAALLTAAMAALYRGQKLNKLTLLAASLAAAAAECVFVELLCSLYYGYSPLFSWSPFVLAPCLFISFAFFFINGNRAIREEVRRRVHF